MATVNLMAEGTPSFASVLVCAFMPPFFFPLLGCVPTPLNMRMENRDMVVERFVKRAQSTNLFGLCRTTETKEQREERLSLLRLSRVATEEDEVKRR